MATRKLLDSLVGKEVCVNLLDHDEFVGILHKTGNETDPNLYLVKNYYYVADDTGNVIGCLFKASYVKKLTNLDIEVDVDAGETGSAGQRKRRMGSRGNY